jgi:hypothetical protein
MSNRIEAIQNIEKARKSKVICYLTGDRQPFITNIGEDVISILFRHLELMGKQKNIDLFLYTRGGDMVVPIRIVKLIRNYCDKFSILVPYRCHSAGTLICLGADEIVMTKLAELTPVDPTSNNHPFNPIGPNPANPMQQMMLPISVEDVRSYLDFAKEKLDAQDHQIVDLYSKMTTHAYQNGTHLHPLALGNVYRVQKMIKIITRKLLELHFKNFDGKENHQIDHIIKKITEDISVHNYPIYFDEAQDLGLNVQNADKKIGTLIWDLFELYSQEMQLTSPFNLIEEIGAEDKVNKNYTGAYIESSSSEDVFNFSYEIKKTLQQQVNQLGQLFTLPNAPVSLNFDITKMQWKRER